MKKALIIIAALLGLGLIAWAIVAYRKSKGLELPAALSNSNSDGGSKSSTSSSKVKGAYAKANDTKLYDAHFKATHTAHKDDWLGRVADEDTTNANFWVLDDGKRVAKVSVYLVQ